MERSEQLAGGAQVQGGGPQGQTQHCPHERRGRRVGGPQRQSRPGRGCDRTGSVLLSPGPPLPCRSLVGGGHRDTGQNGSGVGGQMERRREGTYRALCPSKLGLWAQM